MIVLLMGPAGSGKSTVGRALAQSLGCAFIDADDFHSPENIAAIRRGIGLTDAERQPWLRAVREAIDAVVGRGEDAVVACSALRESYRRLLSEGVPDMRLVYLSAPRHLLEERLRIREGHFAGTAILDTQLAALEPPHSAVVVPASLTVPEIVATVRRSLG